MQINYNPKLKKLAREFRKQGVLSEVLLWSCLKRRRMKGSQFMRQKPIDNFIVDFCCGKLNLIIEIDGISHHDKFDSDDLRQKQLEKLGSSFFTFLRFGCEEEFKWCVNSN